MKNNIQRTLAGMLSISLLSITPAMLIGAEETATEIQSSAADTDNVTYDPIVCSPYTIIELIISGKTYLSFTPIIGSTIIEVDKAPNEAEEIREMMNNNHYFCLVKEEKPYILQLIRGTDTYYTEKVDCDMSVSYVVDVEKKEIRDYNTDEFIRPLVGYCFVVGPFDKEESVWEGRYKNVIYTGSSFISECSNYSDPEQPITRPKGDIDNNGVFDLSDLTTLSLVLLGDKEIPEEQMKYADVTDSGEVDIADLAMMKQMIMNEITYND